MYLLQILLPVLDNDGHEYSPDVFEAIAGDLTRAFGGLTSYTRSPAEGRWKEEERTSYDEIIVLEVMTPHFDRPWWKAFRAELEEKLRQKEVVIRAQPIERV
jgi:hypothetical protein